MGENTKVKHRKGQSADLYLLKLSHQQADRRTDRVTLPPAVEMSWLSLRHPVPSVDYCVCVCVCVCVCNFSQCVSVMSVCV
ncbi:hypothetical protein J4Q44_G00354370 [Coregonus suidteri]|uniref:Uncharacterized protein n=1 Tax=Coregonus suidteri TaxID=861788 RepID=A0AAN8QLY8_9TELE